MAVKKVATEKSSSKPYNDEHDGKKSGGKVKIKWMVSFISCTDDMRQTSRTSLRRCIGMERETRRRFAE